MRSPEEVRRLRRKRERRDVLTTIAAGFCVVVGLLAANAIILYVAVRIVRAAWQ